MPWEVDGILLYMGIIQNHENVHERRYAQLHTLYNKFLVQRWQRWAKTLSFRLYLKFSFAQKLFIFVHFIHFKVIR